MEHAFSSDISEMALQLPKVGDHSLRILAPNLLELVLINTKQPAPARVNTWDWVDEQGNFVRPDISRIRVSVNGQNKTITGVGFKRRPRYAPLDPWELRI